MRLLGAILAGGEARRFGGDKALALLDGRALLDHVADALRPHVVETIVCGRETQGYVCVPDRPRAGLGPLGGLAGALHHATGNGFDAVLAAPCDTPSLPDMLLEVLRDAGGAAFVGSLPVCGLWPVTLAPALDAYLSEDGDRSMRGWARHVGATAIEWNGAILNVNRPADLAAGARGG